MASTKSTGPKKTGQDETLVEDQNDSTPKGLVGLTKLITEPAAFLRQAIEAVPAVKYALGVGGIAAVIAIVAGFLDLRVALVGVPIVIVLMIALLVFSWASAGKAQGMGWAPAFLVWFFMVGLAIVATVFTVTFFVRADILHAWGLRSFYELVSLVPSEEVQQRTAQQFIQEFENAYTGSDDPEHVADALQNLAIFWRLPEQRQILCDFRHNPGSGQIFERAAQLVYDNPGTIMRDVDTVARYFDGIARCVDSQHCDRGATCSYFYGPMDDFKMLYTDYFNDLHALEGIDQMAGVRRFLFSCEQQGAIGVELPAPKCTPSPGVALSCEGSQCKS